MLDALPSVVLRIKHRHLLHANVILQKTRIHQVEFILFDIVVDCLCQLQ